MSEIDYEKFAEALAKKIIEQTPALEKELWDSADGAKFFSVTRDYFTDKLSKTYGFPAAIKLPSEGSRSRLRWFSADIKEWVKQQKLAS
jgi:predicted DNA-binding transcriptional regulator AlpA